MSRNRVFGETKPAWLKLVWILKFRQWFCRPSFETALAPGEIPWRIGGNSSPLFPLVVFILPSDDQGGLNERGEGRALTPLCPMVKDYPQSFFGMKPSTTPSYQVFFDNFLVQNELQKLMGPPPQKIETGLLSRLLQRGGDLSPRMNGERSFQLHKVN